MRLLQRPDLARGAGAVFGAKQLLLDAVWRHRRRVEDDEGGIGPRGLHVNDAGGKLLARARGAADQNAAVGGRHAIDRVAELVDGRGLADHLGAEARALPQLLHLALQLKRLERAQRDEDQAVGLERLLDVIVGAALDSGHRRLDVAVARDDDDRQIGIASLHVGQHLEAVEAAALQPDIENDEMRAALLDRAQRLVAVAGEPRTVTFVLEYAGHEIADVGLVIDDEDVCGHRSLLQSNPFRPAGPGAVGLGRALVLAALRRAHLPEAG